MYITLCCIYVYWTQQSSRRDKKRVVRVFFARTQHDNTSHHITSTTNRKKSNLTYATTTTDIARAHRHHCLWAAINVKTLFAHKCKIECYYSTRLSYTKQSASEIAERVIQNISVCYVWGGGGGGGEQFPGVQKSADEM